MSWQLYSSLPIVDTPTSVQLAPPPSLMSLCPHPLFDWLQHSRESKRSWVCVQREVCLLAGLKAGHGSICELAVHKSWRCGSKKISLFFFFFAKNTAGIFIIIWCDVGTKCCCAEVAWEPPQASRKPGQVRFIPFNAHPVMSPLSFLCILVLLLWRNSQGE